MGRTQAGRAFLFVGNHPCLDFINTQMISRGDLTDLLGTFNDLAAWLVQAGLLTKAQGRCVRQLAQTEKEDALEQARSFRTTLRTMVESLGRGRTVPVTAVTAINRLLACRPGYPQLIRTRAGKFEERFVSSSERKDALLTPLAGAASDLLCSAEPAQIRKCRNEACILYFYDTTKNHARSWCSMKLCGNRMKVAAYFQRKRPRTK